MAPSDAVRFILGEDFETSPLTTHSFSLHGLTLKVSSNSAFILNAIVNLLDYFKCERVTQEAEVHFFLIQYPLSKFHLLPLIQKEGRLLFDSEKDDELDLSRKMDMHLKYFFWKDFYFADFGSKGVFALDIFKGSGVGLFPDPASLHPRTLSNFMFLIGLSEMLRSRNLYLIHAAALAREGKGVLIPGFTGNGKTTLSIALLSGGFKFLSDDRPFLKRNKDEFQLLAFPEGLDVTGQTISFFPELTHSPNDVLDVGLRKKTFRVEKIYPDSIVNSCRPKVLLFPNIVKKKRSRLKPISKIEAVAKLLPHSLLVFDQEVSEKHFHLLCQLVEEIDCYRLDFGMDFLEVHQLIEEIL